jgi:hypothetical protein
MRVSFGHLNTIQRGTLTLLTLRFRFDFHPSRVALLPLYL